MLLKDKIFIVFYLDVRDVDPADWYNYMKQVEDLMLRLNDGSVESIIVPIKENSRVDCINPVLLNAEQYKEVAKKVRRYKRAYKELAKKMKIEEESE